MTRRCFICAPESCMCDEVRPIEILRPSEGLRTLAHNLAIGAALCRAFIQGGRRADLLWDVDRWNGQELWRPGCGRPAP